LQSQRLLKSGDRFCSISTSMFDQVMPLSTVEQLATYAQSKPIQQALAVDECPAAPTPRGKGQTASVAEFMANHVVGVQMRHYPFAEGAAAQAWLRSP
jgi:hypothetical protein